MGIFRGFVLMGRLADHFFAPAPNVPPLKLILAYVGRSTIFPRPAWRRMIDSFSIAWFAHQWQDLVDDDSPEHPPGPGLGNPPPRDLLVGGGDIGRIKNLPE
jgi:hypothetical protein